MPLSRDDILAADDRSVKEVEVPEWGGAVMVRALSGKDRDQFEASIFDPKTQKVSAENMRARLVSMVLVGPDGDLLFSADDVDALGQKSAVALNRVYEVAQGISGLGSEAEKALEGN